MRINLNRVWWVRIKSWFGRRRLWLARKYYGTVTVVVKQGGHKHFVRGVRIDRQMEVKIPIIQGPIQHIPGTVAEGKDTFDLMRGSRPWPQDDIDALRKKVHDDHASGRTDGFGRFVPEEEDMT